MTDVRQTKGNRPMFGNEDTERAWALRCVEQRALQPVDLAVAPSCTVMTHDGRRLTEGDEVQLARDFIDVSDHTTTDHTGHRYLASGASAVVQLANLVEAGIVLDRRGWQPAAAPNPTIGRSPVR